MFYIASQIFNSYWSTENITKKKTFYTIEKQFHRLCPLCCESIASNYLLTRWHIQEPSVYLFIPTLTIIPIYHSFHERQFAIKGGVDRFVYFSINEPEDLWFCIRPKRKTRNCTFASKAKIYNYFWFLLRPLSFLFFVWIVLMIKINTRSTILFFNSDFKVFFFFLFCAFWINFFASCYPYTIPFLAVIPGYQLEVYTTFTCRKYPLKQSWALFFIQF